MKIDNQTYDRLKWVSLVFFPALNIFILSVGKIWDLPYYVQIAATGSAVAVFLGALLKKSGDEYWEDIEAPQDNFSEMDPDDFEEYEGDDDEDAEDSAEE